MTKRRTRLAVWRDKRLFDILADVGSFVLFAFRRFINDGMTQAAGALTFSTLLALVPLLVIAFAVLSGFPAFDDVKARMEDLVFGALVPEVGAGARIYLENFTHNAYNLTTIGIVALALAAVLLLSTIESTLNQIWRVEHLRPMTQRLLVFWAILTVGPLLLGASFTLTSDLVSGAQHWLWGDPNRENELLASGTLKVVLAVALQSFGLTLLFRLVPARRVRLIDAAIGGIFSGIALQLLRYGFNLYLTSSSTYATVYGAVAIIPIFLVWLYSCWTVIILGAVLAASFPDWWRRRDQSTDTVLTPTERLEVAFAVLSVFARKARTGSVVSQDRLAEAVPVEARDEMVEVLRSTGFIIRTDNDRLCLARDLHRTSVAQLAREINLTLGVENLPDTTPEPHGSVPATAPLTALLRRLRDAEDDILSQPIDQVLGLNDPQSGRSPTPVIMQRTS